MIVHCTLYTTLLTYLLYSGGTQLTVHGSNLDSVAEPYIVLTTVLTSSVNSCPLCHANITEKVVG